MSTPKSGKRLTGRKLLGGNGGILLALVLMIAVFSIANHKFFSVDNAINIIRQVSLNGIMACGMTCLIVSGGMDLSIGSIYAICGMMSGVFMLGHMHPIPAILLGLLLGAICGMVNGLIVTKLKVPPMIATLGTQFIYRGTALVLTGGGIVNLKSATNASTYNAPVAEFLKLGAGKIAGIFPNMAAIFVVVAIIMYIVFHKTLLGFKFRAVGGNAEASKVCGINADRVKIIAFTIMGFLAGLAGIINIGYLKSVQGTMGESIEMDIIAASIIGGTSLNGGYGTIVGTIIGVLIYGVMKAGLVYVGITSYMQKIFIGGIIIVAVSIDMLTKKNKK